MGRTDKLPGAVSVALMQCEDKSTCSAGFDESRLSSNLIALHAVFARMSPSSLQTLLFIFVLCGLRYADVVQSRVDNL